MKSRFTRQNSPSEKRALKAVFHSTNFFAWSDFFYYVMSFQLELMMDQLNLYNEKSISTTKLVSWKTGLKVDFHLVQNVARATFYFCLRGSRMEPSRNLLNFNNASVARATFSTNWKHTLSFSSSLALFTLRFIQTVLTRILLWPFQPETELQALTRLWYFTLAYARRFFSLKVDVLDRKGLTNIIPTSNSCAH